MSNVSGELAHNELSVNLINKSYSYPENCNTYLRSLDVAILNWDNSW